ncbi:MAG: hypothetical protein LBJ18_02820 [Rickettsiales bacterium]|jgi:hypothetical protein|nr:hypothetical protein [Rickettsiales bacterium]
MKNSRRLFIFAGYDASGIIDDSALLYARALSSLGDIIFFMDNNAAESELNKFRKIPNVLFAGAARHNEYDFGSYKRGFEFAKNHGILENYDWVYFVNDSVYGPLTPMRGVLEKLESDGSDAVAMVATTRVFKKQKFIESWFWGISPRVFLLDEFQQFIAGVKRQPTKEAIAAIYERGITDLLCRNNFATATAYDTGNRGIYNRPERLFRRGLPFVKKASLTRHNGELGAQIARILRRTPAPMRAAIMQNANRVFGADYMNWLLSAGPLATTTRKIKYIMTKVF